MLLNYNDRHHVFRDVTVLVIDGWGDGRLLLCWGVGVGVSALLQSKVVVDVTG